MPPEAVIQTNGLSKAYRGAAALNALDLTVHEHSIFGFLGPNGAGKTTTIKLLLGLIRPSAGSASAFGMDIVADSVAIRTRVGYLPQEPHFYEHLTARQTLRFTARFFFRGPSALIEKRIDDMLKLVGLPDKADRPIRSLSGGERQRLGIAQAQVNYPDLLILDEPTASLDPIGRRDVLTVMERLREHTTVFYSTHILDDVQRVSDNVAILNHGDLIAEGPIETLLAGSGGAVYTLVLETDGADSAYQRIAAQPWVSNITAEPHNGLTNCQIAVADEAAARAQLLRLALADEGATVVEFSRKRHNLEEIFMQIVQEDEHGQQ